MPLQLSTTHPDRAGGLSFLEESVYGFAPLLFAQGISVSGLLARRAQMLAASVVDWQFDGSIGVVTLAVLVLLPMCLLAHSIIHLRPKLLFAYGELASEYVRDLDD